MCDRAPVRTLLIVDDHAGFRAVARAALAGTFDVVGEATDGAAALALARALDPDVVLVDVQLPDTDGFALAAALAADDDRPAVVLTSTLDRQDIEALIAASPACGFVEKERLSAAALAALLP